MLLVGVKRNHRAQYQQLDAAGLEQLNLVGLGQWSEGADLLGHGDDPSHAELGDVDEVSEAGRAAVEAVHGGVLRLQRRPVGVQQFVDGTRVGVLKSYCLRTDWRD